MRIPYRTQQWVKRILLVLAVVVAVLAIVGVCWFLWIQRYVVYTADGKAKLDFNLPPMPAGQAATPPETIDVTIHFEQSDDKVTTTTTDLVQMEGYYVEASDLQDIAALKEQILKLPAGTPVMVDVKNIKGDFFYSSTVSVTRSSEISTGQFDELIQTMNDHGVYAIAKLPALRDYIYGLNNVPDGVLHSSGGYLYMDDDGCYWLHPGQQGTLTFLTKIITELRNLGFDEVVLEDFCFPETTKILVTGDKAEYLTNAAATLLKACATEEFALSFVRTAPFTMPEGRSRLYLKSMDATQAAAAAQESGISDTAVKLVFLTELHDTRFNVYSVLRPISGADVGE